MITLLAMTDGRDDVLAETLPVAMRHVPHRNLVIHDDTGDLDHQAQLAAKFPTAEVIGGAERRGFGGAIQAAWQHLTRTPNPFVVHLEDDFVLNRPLDWFTLAHVLDTHPHLVQLALRRQPWNAEEHAAGGIVEQHPDDYTERSYADKTWLEHTRFFTTNPSIYRRSLCVEGWPTGENSEGRCGIDLLARHPEWRFGFWGSKDSGEWCEHVGHERVGTGY